MGVSETSITSEQLRVHVGARDCPLIYDVRRRAVFDEDDAIIPGAKWRDHRVAGEWAAEIPPGRDVVVYCVHGHNVSQVALAQLRAAGRRAVALSDGIAGYREAGGIVLKRAALAPAAWETGTRWVTRERPKIDRIACPWLIKRFVDPGAAFFFVAPEFVRDTAEELRAIPYDIPDVEFSHDGDLCSFDTFLRRFGLTDPALQRLAVIVRGADTGRPELAPQAAGLLAMSLGLSAICGDDQRMLSEGLLFYDALYGWCRHAVAESHGWPPR
jgi:rhodanese-related sulfurtransferase